MAKSSSTSGPEETAARVLAADASSHDLWRAGRALSGEPDLEWSFRLFVCRALALSDAVGPEDPRGDDLSYEPLSRWGEVVAALRLNQLLYAAGVAPGDGYVLTAGMEFFDSGYRVRDGHLPLPTQGDAFRGRHSVALVDVTPSDELLFPNSWGQRWGDDGFGTISRAYFENHVDAVWAERKAWLGPSPAARDCLRPRGRWLKEAAPGTPEAVAREWLTGNRRKAKQITIAGHPFEVTMRETSSAREGAPQLDIVSLRRGGGRIVGRAHVLHRRDVPLSVLEELFVHPEERRRGYGAGLDELAADIARRRGQRPLKTLLHEADATAAGHAIAFAEARGYRWVDRTSRRPNVSGFGVRAIT